MDLDRSQLDDPRLRHIRMVESLRRVANLEPANPQIVVEIERARIELALLVKPEAPFSAMTQDLLAA